MRKLRLAISIVTMGIIGGIFASSALLVFVFAGLSYHSGEYLIAIAATGILATALLVVQTMDRNTIRPQVWSHRTWRLRTVWNTFIVGVAIHYSAIIIGVSFGAVFSVSENSSAWAIVAVMVQQAVLTRAAWVLVNEYRQSNAGKNRKP